MADEEKESGAVEEPATPSRPRGVAYARVWTSQAEPVTPAVLSDELFARGFVPGVVVDAEAEDAAPVSEAGLADVRLAVGGAPVRFVSLSSSKGFGSLVSVRASSKADLPDDYLAARTVPNPKLVYTVEAGGPGNSDRNLCENIAEILMVLTDGLAEIGGRGAKKGNRPALHRDRWLGSIRV